MRKIVWSFVILIIIVVLSYVSQAGVRCKVTAVTVAFASWPWWADSDFDTDAGHGGAACYSQAQVPGAWADATATNIFYDRSSNATIVCIGHADPNTERGSYCFRAYAQTDPIRIKGERNNDEPKIKEGANSTPLSIFQPPDTSAIADMNFNLHYDSLSSILNLSINGTLKVKKPTPSSQNYYGNSKFRVTVYDSLTVMLLFEAWCQVNVAADGSVTESHSSNLDGSITDASTVDYAIFAIGYGDSVSYSGAFDDVSPLLESEVSGRDANIPEVVINEILYNPVDIDSTEEWVEIFNAEPDTMDLTGWTLTNCAVTDSIELPTIEIPSGAYLVVRFQVGPNDFDFSDGAGMYSTGTVSPIFGNYADACALYAGAPDSMTLIDFVAWSAEGVAPMGRAMNHAVAAGQWLPGSFLNTAYEGGAFVEPWTAGPGETIGRDAISTDTNTPLDWSDHGGPDALADTEGRANNGPYYLGEELILIAQQSVNQFLWDFGLNVTGASHSGTSIVESDSDVVTIAIHKFDIYSRVDGTNGTMSGEINCHWQELDQVSWQLDMACSLASTRGMEMLEFTSTMVDSGVLIYNPCESKRFADIDYTTPMGHNVSQFLDVTSSLTWASPSIVQGVDVRMLNDTRGISLIRSTNTDLVILEDSDEEVNLNAVTTFADPPGAPTEYFEISASKHHKASGELDGMMHSYSLTTNGHTLYMDSPSPFTWTSVGPDSFEFDQTMSLGCPSHGFENAVLHGACGAAFDPSGDFIIRGNMTTSVGLAPPMELTYYADGWWRRALSAAGWLVGCAAGVVATAPSIGGALVVGSVCGAGLVASDIYLEEKCKDKSPIALQDDIPPPLINFPRDVCCVPTAVSELPVVPETFRLAQNYPNPFNPITAIHYDLPVDCRVRLEVYNILGQRVAVLVEDYQKAGSKVAQWDGRDANGLLVSSGIYFYRLRAGSFTDTKKMVLLK